MGHHLHHPSLIASKACGDRDVQIRRLFFVCSVVCPWVCVNLYASLFFFITFFPLGFINFIAKTYNVFTLWFLGHCFPFYPSSASILLNLINCTRGLTRLHGLAIGMYNGRHYHICCRHCICFRNRPFPLHTT